MSAVKDQQSPDINSSLLREGYAVYLTCIPGPVLAWE